MTPSSSSTPTVLYYQYIATSISGLRHHAGQARKYSTEVIDHTDSPTGHPSTPAGTSSVRSGFNHSAAEVTFLRP